MCDHDETEAGVILCAVSFVLRGWEDVPLFIDI